MISTSGDMAIALRKIKGLRCPCTCRPGKFFSTAIQKKIVLTEKFSGVTVFLESPKPLIFLSAIAMQRVKSSSIASRHLVRFN